MEETPKAIVKIGDKIRELTGEDLIILQRQATKLEKVLHENENISIVEWFEVCWAKNVHEKIMKEWVSLLEYYDLVSELGWAWLTKIYIPQKQKTNNNSCPRSRAWQIKENDK